MTRFCDNPNCDMFETDIEVDGEEIECWDGNEDNVYILTSNIWEGELDEELRFCTECFDRVLEYGIEDVIENYYDRGN